ncbi:MAG: biosynthetic-type acetolactate synthase large subunit [Lachnospiraceae bacterium]|nr:biosynthetic-type acetolactate synthase large subunit [Lachnospiraceae bacterium]
MDIAGKKLVIKALREEKVDTVFGYPGGMIIDIFDELYKEEDMHVVLPRHEQALIHEAEGYARATGKTAVCMVTSGPGATNIITGLADAHFDSIPLVVITGQVALPLIGNDAFQEVDIVGMTRSVTKYGVTVRNRDDLGRILKDAFYIAKTGRPGPVIIDIPKDIQNEKGSSEYPTNVMIRGYKPATSVHLGQLKKAYKLLHSAKCPVILAGGGIHISHAETTFKEFVEKTGIPVITTVMGKGVIPTDHPLYFGNCGLHGEFSANTAISKCDVLFSIGTRFNDRITGNIKGFAPNAKIVHIDIDTSSISRNVRVDVPVVSDAGLALHTMCSYATKSEIDGWVEQLGKNRAEHPLDIKADGVSPKRIMEAVNKSFDDCIITTDVGQHQMWACQYLDYGGKKQLITSGGLGTMGFGFPAAVGAKIGNPDKTVICITGDGGFQMNMQEMATAVCEDINVIVLLINNHYLGMVHQMQQLFYGKRYSATCLENTRNISAPAYVPDFVKWAESYGACGIRVEKDEDIIPAIENAKRNTGGCTVIEFMTGADNLVLPMIKPGQNMTDMLL